MSTAELHVFPLSRTLLVVASLELVGNRILSELLRPAPGQSGSRAFVVIDAIGLYTFYFATLLAIFSVFLRGAFAARTQSTGSTLALGLLAMAGLASLLAPSIDITATALHAGAALVLIVAIVRAWQSRASVRLALGVSAWGLWLLAITGTQLAVPYGLGAEHHEAIMEVLSPAAILLGILSPSLFAPRPLSESLRRSGPWLVAIMTTATLYSGIHEQPFQFAEVLDRAFGIHLFDGVIVARLIAAMFALGLFIWTIASNTLSWQPRDRKLAAGLLLIVLGGFSMPWPLYSLLGVVGLWHASDAARDAPESL